MKYLISLIPFFVSLPSNAQDSLQQFFFPEVGWTININPSKFADTTQFNSIARRASNAINDTYGSNVDLAKQIHPLFTIIDGNYNMFGSTINLFDSSLFPNWELSYEASKQMLLNVINNQSGAIQILDSLSGYEMIAGLRFEKFYVKTYYPGQAITMNTYWLYRKQNQYDFSINISYTDEQKGKMFLEVVRNSKFKK